MRSTINGHQENDILRLEQYIKRDPIFIFFCILATLPIWIVEYPPMVDLAQHAAQIAMFSSWMAGDFRYDEFFNINLFTPYLFGYGITWILSFFLPMIIAMKLVLSVSTICFCLITAELIKFTNGNPSWRWLTISVAVGLSYYWGFYNYLIAAPIGLFYFLYGLRYAGRPTIKNGLILSVFGPVLFFCHALIAVFFIGALGLFIILKDNNFKRNLIITAPLFSLLPIALIWLSTKMFGVEDVNATFIQWEYIPVRYTSITAVLLGSSTQLASVIGSIIILAPFITGGQLTKSVRYLAPLFLVVIIILLAPNHAMGTSLLYPRFIILLIPMLLFAMQYNSDWTLPTARHYLAPFLALSVIIFHSNIAYKFEQDQQSFKTIIKQIPPEKRILSLMLNPWSNTVSGPVYNHFPAWYQSKKNGLVDFSFAMFSNLPVAYKTEFRPTRVALNNLNWQRDQAKCYDFFLSRSNQSPFKGNPKYTSASKLISQQGTWRLYENIAREKCQWDL
jgi:hypothetical protein